MEPTLQSLAEVLERPAPPVSTMRPQQSPPAFVMLLGVQRPHGTGALRCFAQIMFIRASSGSVKVGGDLLRMALERQGSYNNRCVESPILRLKLNNWAAHIPESPAHWHTNGTQ